MRPLMSEYSRWASARGTAAGEHGLRGFGGELLAVLRGSGLHDDRPALHRTGDVKRAPDGKIFSLVVQHVHLRGIEIQSALDVPHKRVVGKGIPQPGDHVIELARAPV